jgi:general stress protein YciG
MMNYLNRMISETDDEAAKVNGTPVEPNKKTTDKNTGALKANNSAQKPAGQKKTGTSNRGFASMDAQRQREIASKGGQAAHAQGKAHEFSSEEARIAGRKGGEAAHARGTAHKFSTEEARRAGKKGALQSRSQREQHKRNGNSESQRGDDSYASNHQGGEREQRIDIENH